jgi:tetratricopeptide (TPR) repeat protein
MNIGERFGSFSLSIAIILPLASGITGTAAQTMDAAKLKPEDAALFQRALDAQRDRNLATAERDYRDLLARTPGFLPARFNLGLVLDAEGSTAEAFDTFNAVAKINPDFPALQMFIGIEGFRLKRLDAAENALQIATKQTPADLHCWFWLARVDFEMDKTGEGKTALDRALAISPDDPSSLYLLAQYQISMQNFTGAERVLSDLAKRYPQLPDFHRSLGSVYYLEARLKDAEDEYREALKLDAGDPQALSMLGVILLDRGQAEQAVPYLEQGLEANPHIAYLQRKMGQALLESGETEKAVEHLREAIGLNPQEATAHFLLWKAYIALNRRKEATQELEEFRRLQSQPKTATDIPGFPAGSTVQR